MGLKLRQIRHHHNRMVQIPKALVQSGLLRPRAFAGALEFNEQGLTLRPDKDPIGPAAGGEFTREPTALLSIKDAGAF